MSFEKGHKISVGNKGGGRKSLREEVAIIKEKMREEITNEMLAKLAKSKVYNAINEDGLTFAQIKEMALPVVLRNITEKIDHTSKGESIVNNDKIDNLANILNGIHKRGNLPSDGIDSDLVDSQV